MVRTMRNWYAFLRLINLLYEAQHCVKNSIVLEVLEVVCCCVGMMWEYTVGRTAIHIIAVPVKAFFMLRSRGNSCRTGKGGMRG
jgi:hypothetical protein